MRPVNVTICSPFRDAEGHLDQYFSQLYRLRTDDPMIRLRMVFVEGDSVDTTWAALVDAKKQDPRIDLVRCHTGKPKYGSVVNAERFAALATVFNAGLGAVSLGWSDYVLFLPCDIVYGPDMLRRLLSHDKDIVAPYSWTEGGRLYDTWGFTKDGKELGRITQSAVGDQPQQMDTVGGTVLIRSDVLRAGARYTPAEVDRGLCKAARAGGFTVWADPSTAVYHPPFDPGLLERPRFQELANAQSAQTFRKLTLDRYGFDCGPEYAADFVTFWESLRHGQP